MKQLKSKIEGDRGVVYLLVHPLQPNVVKIGSTRRTAIERAKEIADKAGTSLALKHFVVFAHKTNNHSKLERLVHKRLENYRIDKKREYFTYVCGVENVIKAIIHVEQQLKTQQLLSEDYDDLYEWWLDLDPVWKHVFKREMVFNEDPNDDDLLEGVYTMISHSRNPVLRKKIASLIEHRDFNRRISKWYLSLSDDLKQEVKSFVRMEVSKEQIIQITQLKRIDCSGNNLIQNLAPLSKLTSLEEVDFSSTSVSDLAPLKNLNHLRHIKMNHTYVNSLDAISELQLDSIECYSTGLTKEQIGSFKEVHPNCLVDDNPMM